MNGDLSVGGGGNIGGSLHLSSYLGTGARKKKKLKKAWTDEARQASARSRRAAALEHTEWAEFHDKHKRGEFIPQLERWRYPNEFRTRFDRPERTRELLPIDRHAQAAETHRKVADLYGRSHMYLMSGDDEKAKSYLQGAVRFALRANKFSRKATRRNITLPQLAKMKSSLERLRWSLVLKAWSDEARRAALEARRSRTKGNVVPLGAEHGRVEQARAFHGLMVDQVPAAAEHYARAKEHFRAGRLQSGNEALESGHLEVQRSLKRILPGLEEALDRLEGKRPVKDKGLLRRILQSLFRKHHQQIKKEWSDEARRKAAEARRAQAKPKPPAPPPGTSPRHKAQQARRLKEKEDIKAKYKGWDWRNSLATNAYVGSQRQPVATPVPRPTKNPEHRKFSEAASTWRDWAIKHGAHDTSKHYEQAREHFAVGNVESGHRAMRFGHSSLGRVMPHVIRSVMKL